MQIQSCCVSIFFGGGLSLGAIENCNLQGCKTWLFGNCHIEPLIILHICLGDVFCSLFVPKPRAAQPCSVGFGCGVMVGELWAGGFRGFTGCIRHPRCNLVMPPDSPFGKETPEMCSMFSVESTCSIQKPQLEEGVVLAPWFSQDELCKCYCVNQPITPNEETTQLPPKSTRMVGRFCLDQKWASKFAKCWPRKCSR